jgi:hypothetical protein
MIDHGFIASHAAKSLLFLQIHTHSGQISYHEDIHGLSPAAIKKLRQSPRLVARGDNHSNSTKALGTQTVSQPPRPDTRHPYASTTSLSPEKIPSRSSSKISGLARDLANRKTASARLCHRQRTCKHFSSIDELLAATSGSKEDGHSEYNRLQQSERQLRSQFNTVPRCKRPPLVRSQNHEPDRPKTSMPRSSHEERTAFVTSTERFTATTLSSQTSRHLSSSRSHNHTFPTTTLAITHHPNFQSPSSSKRPSLHEPHTLSWTSDTTRRLEYAKIDRAYSGVRGFCRKVLPSVCFRDGRRNFWDRKEEEEGDDDAASDADSVRRYRLTLSESPRGEAHCGEKWPLVVAQESDRARARGFSCF